VASSFKTFFDVIGRDLATPVFAKVGAGLRALQGQSAAAQKTAMGAGAATAKAHNMMAKSFSTMAVGGGFLSVGRGLIDALGRTTEIAGEFGLGLAAVGAVTRATADEMRQLEDAAIQAGIKTQFSPVEAIQGLQDLATAGQVSADAITSLDHVLNLAAGSLGQMTVSESAQAVVGSLNAYGMGAEKARVVTDKLLRITQLTNFQARDFAVGLSKAAAAGATFDQKMDDVLITMGLIRNRNIDASVAATAYRASLRRLGAHQGAQQALQKKGIEVFEGEERQMRSAVDIMLDLAEKTKTWTDEERNRIVVQSFGARGLFAFNAIQKATYTRMIHGTKVTLEGREAIAALREEMENAGGTAVAFKKKLLETYAGQKTLLRGTLETIQVVVGKPLTKLLGPVVGFVTEMLNKFIKAWQGLPEPVQKAVIGFVGIVGVVSAIAGGFLILHGIMNLLGISFTGLAITIGKVLLLAGPLVLAISALGLGAGGIIRTLQKNLGGLGESWDSMADKAKLGMQGVIELLRTGALAEDTLKKLGEDRNKGVAKFLEMMTGVIGKAKAFFKGVKEGYDSALAGLQEPWNRLKQAIESVFGRWFDLTGQGTKSVDGWAAKGRKFGGVIAGATEGVLELATHMIELGGQIQEAMADVTMEDIIAGAQELFELLKQIASALGTIASGVNKTASVLGGGGGELRSALLGDASEMSLQQMHQAIDFAATQGDAPQVREAWRTQVKALELMKQTRGFGAGEAGEQRYRKALESVFRRQAAAGYMIATGDVEKGTRAQDTVTQLVDMMLARQAQFYAQQLKRPLKIDLKVGTRELGNIVTDLQEEVIEEGLAGGAAGTPAPAPAGGQ